jgi:hypothetical protein
MVGLRAITRRVPPIATEEMIIVLLWVKRDETNPEPSSPAQYPREMKRKRAPASPCPMFRSPSMVGSRGASTMRERKLIKNIPVRKSSDGICERKVTIVITPHAVDYVAWKVISRLVI